MSVPAKHTAGPHTVVAADHLGDPAFAIRAPDGDLIAVGLLRGDADLFAAAPTMFEALKAQEHAENEHANCPDCDGTGDWAECGPCSELFGTAIELRRAAIAFASPVLEREGK